MGKNSLKLKGLTIKIGGDTSDLNKSLDSVQKKGSGLGNELKEINRLLKLDPTNTEMLAQKQQVLAQSIGNTEEKLALLKNAEKMAQEQFAKGDISEEQYRALQREILSAENHLEGLKKQAKQTDDAIENLGKETDETAKRTKEMDQATTSLADGGMAALAATAAATAAAVAAVGKASAEAYGEVDGGADAVIIKTGAVGNKAEDLIAVYKKVAANAVGSFEDIGNTVGEINTRFGYTGKQLEECSISFMKFAKVTGVNSTDAVVSVTRALNDAGIPLDRYNELLDILVKTGQAAGIDVSALADELSTNGATMRAMGFDMAESIALLAQFELSGADAATMLTGMKRAMATWTEAGKDGREEFGKLVEGVKDGSITAADALDIFGTRAGPQLVDAIQSGKFEYQSMLAVVNSSHGALNETFEELDDALHSAERSGQRAKLMLSDLGEVIAEAAAPAVESFLDELEKDKTVEKIADTIKNDVLPAIFAVGDWTKKNAPVIKSGLTAVTAGIVAYKAAIIATTVAQKGLKGAIMATEIAQKALAAAQAATPWGLILTAVTAATSALVALTLAAQKAEGPVNVLTDEEKKLMEAAEEAAEAFRDQQKATNETLRSITANMEYIGDLSNELLTLADASGKVKAEDEARAQFILNEMNEALDTEYQMIDGVIQQYDTLKASIESVMQSKLANMLLESAKADYVTAREGQNLALESSGPRYEEYQAQLEKTKKAQEKYETFAADYYENLTSGAYALGQTRKALDDFWLAHLQAKKENEEARLAETKNAYDESAENYGRYYNTIATYEEAQQAVLEGNYQKTIDLLSQKGGAYGVYSDKVDEETAHVLGTLQKEAIDAGLAADYTRRQFEEGIEGYTEEMVTEAEKNYNAALDKFANAYADAEAVGEDLTGGMTAGAENGRNGLLAKARSLVLGFLNAARAAADSHSPSRKAIKIFEDIGAGAEIGIENKTKDVKRAGTEQATAVLDAYREQEVRAQRVMRNVEPQLEAYTTAGISAAGSYAPLLEQILNAINDGKLLLLDGEAVVGGTVNRMDNRLGALQVLADRGAT